VEEGEEGGRRKKNKYNVPVLSKQKVPIFPDIGIQLEFEVEIDFFDKFEALIIIPI
jgi:hypothetical protein